MDREKVKKFIKRCTDKANDSQLRVIAMVSYHITR